MGKNTENTFSVIISLQLVGFSSNLVEMFFSRIPMQCPSQNSKFENFRHFIGGARPPVSIGGVLDRYFGPPVTGGSRSHIFCFFIHSEGKEKICTYLKGFLKILSKSLKI